MVILQMILGLALIVLITIQVKGKGLGRVWGTGQTSFSRRGLETLIFKLTFVVGGLFVLVSALRLFV